MSEQYYILFWNYQRKIDLKICKGQYDNIFFSKGRVVSFFGEEGSVSNTILYFNKIFSVIEGWTLLLLFSWFFRLSASLQCGSYSQINIPACCLHQELICWQHSALPYCKVTVERIMTHLRSKSKSNLTGQRGLSRGNTWTIQVSIYYGSQNKTIIMWKVLFFSSKIECAPPQYTTPNRKHTCLSFL